MRLDEFLPPDVEVAFLKIDTEGADTWVLQGCEALLRVMRVSCVCFEDDEAAKSKLRVSSGAAVNLLEKWGYRLSALESGTRTTWLARA